MVSTAAAIDIPTELRIVRTGVAESDLHHATADHGDWTGLHGLPQTGAGRRVRRARSAAAAAVLEARTPSFPTDHRLTVDSCHG